MKNIFLPMIMFLVLMTSCSSDDDSVSVTSETETDDTTDGENDDTGMAIIRFAEVNVITDQVVLTNLGDAAIEVGEYFMCLGPGTYAQVSGLTDENTSLAPNTSITLSYDMDPMADGLSIFTTNTFESTDPTVLLDYVQWGAADQPRVDQAVTAGRWDDASSYVMDGSPYMFSGTATDFGSTFWDGTPVSSGELRILTVDTTTDEVTFTNLGGTTLDIADYWLCLGPGTYLQISAVATAGTTIDPNGTLTVSYDMDPEVDGLSIFSENSFSSTDPTVLLDFVQWGAGNQPRADQAVAAGRWGDISNFVMGASPYNFNGESEDVGVAFWE